MGHDRNVVTLPQHIWDNMLIHDVYINATEAVQYGFVEDIRDFQPPQGVPIWSI